MNQRNSSIKNYIKNSYKSKNRLLYFLKHCPRVVVSLSSFDQSHFTFTFHNITVIHRKWPSVRCFLLMEPYALGFLVGRMI